VCAYELPCIIATSAAAYHTDNCLHSQLVTVIVHLCGFKSPGLKGLIFVC